MDVPLLRSKKSKSQDVEIVAEKQSLMLSRCAEGQVFCAGGTAVHGCSAGESPGTMTLFRNEVAKQVLQDSLDYNPKQRDLCYLKRNIVSIC